MFDRVLPVAVLTADEVGVVLVPVADRDGVLVDRRSGVPVDLVSLVTVLGEELLEPVAA